MCLESWLKLAFQPLTLKVDRNAARIYLNFFSKLLVGDNVALLYLNNERQTHGLSQILDAPRAPAPESSRIPPNLSFKKRATATTKPVGRGKFHCALMDFF
jgi:hypothetical protein